jgi:glycosyltransferase involved in cell wall biosynthesis
MNLFLDAHVFDDAGQGSRTYLEGIFKEAIQNRKDINFVMAALDPKELQKEFGTLENVRYEKFAKQNKYYRLAIDIPNKIASGRIDVAHFTYISPLVKKCREIVALHDLLFLDMPQYFPTNYRLTKNYLFKRSARRADWITTLSEYSRESIVRHFGIKREKIIITPCGILDLFWEESKDETNIKEKYKLKDYILYVSRIEPRKNHIALLKAYVELGLWKRDIKLVLIGSPAITVREFDDYLNSLDAKVKSNIVFLKGLTAEEIQAFYSKSLLTVYPSLGEGFGIPPLEAAVCGAQVLCSNATAMRDFHFFGDMHFDPADLGALKEKMTYYINNPLPDTRRLAIRNTIKENYNWSASSELLFSQLH